MKNKLYLLSFITIIFLLSGCMTTQNPERLWIELEHRYNEFNKTENFRGWDITHYFAAIGTYDEMITVLERSENIDSLDFYGNSPIVIAQRYNNIHSYQALLYEGCSFTWVGLFLEENYDVGKKIANAYGYTVEDDSNKRKTVPEFDISKIAPPDLDYLYFDNFEEYPFAPSETNFSLYNAWFLSECSFLAYASPEFAEPFYKRAGYNNFRFIENENNECMVIWDDVTIIIAFRGTEQNTSSTVDDIFTDLKVIQSDFYLGGTVHGGFLEAFKSIWSGPNGLKLLLEELKKEGDRYIWVTGHSLGGALADICYTYLDDATGAYTFGAPRVGNKDFVDLTKGRPIWRVEHNQDPVPTVPFTLSLLGLHYYNVGDLIYIGKFGQVLNMSGTEYTYKYQNYTESFIDQEFFQTPDHMPIFYSVKLWNSLFD